LRSALAPLAIALALPAAAAAQGEIRGMPDPPGTGSRFPGAAMIHYEQRPAAGFAVPTGPAGKGFREEVVDGRLTLAVYRIDKERSPLDVGEAYEAALKDGGFEILYRCAEEACGGRRFNDAVAPDDRRFAGFAATQQYITARKKQESGNLTAQVYVVRGASETIFLRLAVVEEKHP
jgi:OmpA-OmpF porin, OOP family